MNLTPINRVSALTKTFSANKAQKIISHLLITASFMLTAALICLPLTVQAEEIIINAVGDIMLTGRWAATTCKNGYDAPFRRVAAELKTGDITIANLESPIARGGKEFTGRKFRFRAESELADAFNKQDRDGRYVVAF
jgi:Bacterial capsule synthesis protein PGA_cap